MRGYYSKNLSLMVLLAKSHGYSRLYGADVHLFD
jgi:hypothetical protein